MAIKYVGIPHVRKIFQMAIKNTNVFQSNAPQSIPKVLFLGIKIYRLATLVQPFVPFVEQIERFLFKSGSDQLFGASQTFKFCH
jgi:hypothetical protein